METCDLLPLDLVVVVAEHGPFDERILRVKVDVINLIVVISGLNVHEEIMSVG